ncbi:hypothetical protein SDC9_140621 [bioreactor metagenome]|uniref:Uncharacterized protein n=1 Tax=bioreactor metagenome TaxID=1076179 RepID=A0A645DVE6_9ZZZZ
MSLAISLNDCPATLTTSIPSATFLTSSSIAFTAKPMLLSFWLMRAAICVVASRDCSASFRTSSATTANPLPCSPALAASIAALRASKLVWSAIPVMNCIIFPILSELVESSVILCWTVSVPSLILFICWTTLSKACCPA